MSKGFDKFDKEWLTTTRPEEAEQVWGKGKEKEKSCAVGKENKDVVFETLGIVTLFVKPLSVNEGYTGKRYKTKAHRDWHKKVMGLLPEIQIPEPPYEIHYKFGLSSLSADGDNCCKFITDCIAEKYGFNDKFIKRWIIDVDNVEKGKEFFSFKIENLSK